MTLPHHVAAQTNDPAGQIAPRFRRYVLVTLFVSPINLVAFWLVLRLSNWHPALVNVAVASLMVPGTYCAYRRWVWSHHTPTSLRSDVAQFWAVSLVNVGTATAAVAAAERLGATDAVTTASLFGSYAVLWIARFTYLDQIQFRHEGR